MHSPHRGALAGALLSIAVAGLIAGCGSGGSNAATANTPAATTSGAASAAVDRAFVQQMIPHHKLAIVMADTALTSAQHPQLKVLAKEIVAAQAKEITQMTAIATDLGTTPDGSGASMTADAKALGLPMGAMGMSMDTGALARAKPFDRAFIDEMTPHHTGAIAMAKAELARGGDARLKTIATGIIAAQQREIRQMRAWRAAWYGAATAGTSPMGGR